MEKDLKDSLSNIMILQFTLFTFEVIIMIAFFAYLDTKLDDTLRQLKYDVPKTYDTLQQEPGV